MNQASEALDFERAARLRDRLQAPSAISSRIRASIPRPSRDADVFAAHTQGGETCVQVFFFRAGQNWGNRPFFPRHRPRALDRRSARSLHRPILRRAHGAGAGPAVGNDSRMRAARRSVVAARGAQGRNLRAAAGREARDRGDGAAERARAIGPAAGGEQRPARTAGRRGGSSSGSTRRPSASRSTTIPTSRARMRWAA